MRISLTKVLAACLILVTLTSFHKPATECDIAAFYSGVEPDRGSKVLTATDQLEEAKLLLVPTDVNEGKYVVRITRKGSNLYKVDGKSLYIETRYCYEYSYGQEVVLKVDSRYGYNKGKVIF